MSRAGGLRPRGPRQVAAGSLGLLATLAAGLFVVSSAPTGAAVGTAWTAASGALPASDLAGNGPAIGDQAGLAGQVACPTPNLCFAVGGYLDSASNSAAFIASITQQAAGSVSESYVAAPVPAAGSGDPTPQSAGRGHQLSELYSVSCATASFCVAVGDYQDSAGHDWGLVDTWVGGSSWAATLAPEPGSNNAEYGPGSGIRQVAVLWDVDCYAAGSCVAVGSYGDSTGHDWPMIDTLSRGSWTPTTVDVPTEAAGADGDTSWLSAVSCSPTGQCAAGGAYLNFGDSLPVGFLASGSDGSWTSASPWPLMPSGTGDYPDAVMAVSCPPTGPCVAIAAGNSWNVLFAFTDDASGWTATIVPEPAKNADGTPSIWFGDYFAISCTAAQTCVASGNVSDSGGWSSNPTIMTETPAGWTSVAAPLPSGNNPSGYAASSYNASLRALSCSAPGSCVAGGFYFDAAGGVWGLTETLSNGTWTAQTMPDPPGSGTDANSGSPLYGVADEQYAGLFGIGCSSDGSCGAIGTYRTPTGSSALFAAHELA